MATIKWCEIGIVPVTTKALKIHIKNPHPSWEDRQLFLLSSTWAKKIKSPWLESPARTCLHRTSWVRHWWRTEIIVALSSRCSQGAEGGQTLWRCDSGALTSALCVVQVSLLHVPTCSGNPANKVQSRSWPKLTLNLKNSWHHCLCGCTQGC